jgi:hypothetical protein
LRAVVVESITLHLSPVAAVAASEPPVVSRLLVLGGGNEEVIMKRSIILILSLVVFAGGATAQTPPVLVNFVDDFSDVQGGSNLSYQYFDLSTSQYGDMVLGTNMWGQPADGIGWVEQTYKEASIWRDTSAPFVQTHPGFAYDTALVWESDISSDVQIIGSVMNTNPNCGDGVLFSILNNTQTMFQADLDNGGFSLFDLSTTVTPGDRIYLQTNKKANTGCDHTTLAAKIALPSEIQVGTLRVFDLEPTGNFTTGSQPSGHLRFMVGRYPDTSQNVLNETYVRWKVQGITCFAHSWDHETLSTNSRRFYSLYIETPSSGTVRFRSFSPQCQWKRQGVYEDHMIAPLDFTRFWQDEPITAYIVVESDDGMDACWRFGCPLSAVALMGTTD